MKSIVFLLSLLIIPHSVAAERADVAEKADASEGETSKSDEPAVAETDAQKSPPDDGGDIEAVAATLGVDSPCASVKCSNKGACVLKNDQPTCACDEGYQPDTVNGLSCFPSAPVPTPSASSVGTTDCKEDTSISLVHSVLPEYPVEHRYGKYKRLVQDGQYDGTFTDFMATGFQREKKIGSILIGTGAALSVASILFFTFGAVNDNGGDGCSSDDGYNDEDPNRCEVKQTIFLPSARLPVSRPSPFIL